MIEWELDDSFARTGRWRRRQFYALVGDNRVPSQRTKCEWREGVPKQLASQAAGRVWNPS